MESAAAIIDALNARAAPPARLREAARASWSAWLDRSAQRPGRVAGVPAEALVAEFAARAPAPAPARSVELNRWQAFRTLWRQHWSPATRDDRRSQWVAGGVSVVWNLLLVVLLLVVTALRFTPPLPAEDDVVQVEYVGGGTPADAGGGPAPSPAPARADESPAAAASAASATAADRPAAAPSAAEPTPSTAAQAVDAQRVQLTTPVSPEPPVFTLPPTMLPSPAVEVARAPTPDVRVASIPEAVQAPRVPVAVPRVEVSPTSAAAPEVATRAIPDPVRSPAPTASVPSPAIAARADAQSVDVRARTIPAPRPGTAAALTPAPATATAGDAPQRSADGTRPAAGPATAAPSAGVGIGPKAAPSPGAWPTAKRADDWGQSDRNRPGSGIYDGDGRPRLADGPGSASAGHPPGMITQEIRDIDRAGTWLRRKPLPYEPTRWDRLWRPNQTLLDDWVDKGIKQVGIPIPGTNKRIVCIVSILQLGGGCGVSDPNLNEQPATARPPPDVPFKPALQSGNGATWRTDRTPAPPPKLPGLFAPATSGTPPGATGGTDDGNG